MGNNDSFLYAEGKFETDEQLLISAKVGIKNYIFLCYCLYGEVESYSVSEIYTVDYVL